MKKLFILISLIFACSSFQSRNFMSENLEEKRLEKLNILEKSVLKLTCSAYYKTYYYFLPDNRIDSLARSLKLESEEILSRSTAGTGLIIDRKGSEKNLILTCNHVIDFPDSIVTYYLDENDKPTNFIRSRSIKTGKVIFIEHKSGATSHGKLIANDKQRDVALIETDAISNFLAEYPFRAAFGNADKIKFGKEVYMIGFPKGFLMISRGVANPSKYKNQLVVDATFNKGFSGGVVIAFDNMKDTYQYVGMANSMAYDSQYVLFPDKNFSIFDLDKNLPYTGDIYINELKMVNYGITFVEKSNIILDFLKENRTKLREYNFYLTNIISE